MTKQWSAHRFRDSRYAHVLIEYVRSVYCKCVPSVRTQYLKDKADAHADTADGIVDIPFCITNRRFLLVIVFRS